jgi:hypothetical protein
MDSWHNHDEHSPPLSSRTQISKNRSDVYDDPSEYKRGTATAWRIGFDQIAALKAGKIVFAGPTNQMMT